MVELVRYKDGIPAHSGAAIAVLSGYPAYAQAIIAVPACGVSHKKIAHSKVGYLFYR
jgi:hypothetical protein